MTFDPNFKVTTFFNIAHRRNDADKTIIKAKVMHIYVSTTVLANDIQILRFISYCDSERELMPCLEATASISFCMAVANVLTSRLSLTRLSLFSRIIGLIFFVRFDNSQEAPG